MISLLAESVRPQREIARSRHCHPDKSRNLFVEFRCHVAFVCSSTFLKLDEGKSLWGARP